MGKTERFNRERYSTGFASDYRQAVDTMGESEGFGSSGRVETEMTASEDSCAPKRKCINLNVDRCDSFNVPLQVLTLSKMSRPQRKELELKLKSELEQVLSVQKKILSRFTDEVNVSASSGILSCSIGRKRQKTENFHKPAKLSSGQGKKRLPGGRNGANLKRDLSGRFESMTQAAYSSSINAMLMKQCEMLLKRMISHKFGWVFKEPVDVVKLNIPDYFNVIKRPMDFGTIKTKLASGAYLNPIDFAADVRLVFSNAMTYNPPGNDVHVMAETLSKFFEPRWKPIEKKLPVSDSPLGPAKSGVSRELGDVKPSSQIKKRKQPFMNHKAKTEGMERAMTQEEKLSLTRDLESLQGDMLDQVFNFLRERCFGAETTSEAEVEVDIDALSDDTLFSLRKLLNDYMLDKQRCQVKGEACEIELLNESGLSNSSLQPCKVNDLVDEDVDIGGNDPPVSSYPPVVIDKDTALRSSKCSSSSSSSSDSDSSSSDSDSGASSGSESDGGKVSRSGKDAKETAGLEVALDQERSDVLDPHNGSRSGLDQTENSTQSKPVSIEVDGQQEGGNAPSETQISPQKSYRAALLISRFADTILKAQEKTLYKVDKGDPEKLRKEREELERQQRAERARLQAEAKAAEDARRQAEAEAAAEAKRKREIEREAARLALQKMEKTVEINENCQFLKDLEMLSSAPAEHLPSSVDETSPNHSQDGLGSFKFTGSNPLEQLGLYMKVDYEEEEEADADALKAPVDVEEGEID